MSQTLSKLTNILENELLPIFDNQIGFMPSPFIEKIKKPVLTNPGISANTPVGANGGVGFGSEDADIPESGAQMYERFKIAPVSLFGNLEISDKALRLGVGDSSINLMVDQVESIQNTMAFVLGNSVIAGNGTGKLCNISNAKESTDTFTVDDTKSLVEGMKIDIYNAAPNESSMPVHAKKRIMGIDRVKKTITIDEKVTCTNGASYEVYLQGSFRNTILGIEAFFDDSITSIYGVSKSDKTWIKPSVYDCQSNEGLVEEKIMDGIRESGRYKGSNIDMILAGDEAYRTYLDYLKSTKTMPTERQHFQGGVSAIEVLFGDRTVAFVNERHVKDDEIIGVCTSDFLLPKTPVGFLKDEDAPAFQRKPNSTIYQGVIGTYTNLICKRPGGVFKIQNVKRS